MYVYQCINDQWREQLRVEKMLHTGKDQIDRKILQIGS